MANLEAQISQLRSSWRQTARRGCGAQLGENLVIRYSVTSERADRAEIEVLAGRLAAAAGSDPEAWLTVAHLDTALHRPVRAEFALGQAQAAGAPQQAVAGVRAGLLQAGGQDRAALRLSRECLAAGPSALTLSRTACCHLALGEYAEARAAFSAALRCYRSVSPFPLTAMLFNWGHTWDHRGERPPAEQAYRAVLHYLPGHLRARRGLQGGAEDG